MRRQLLRPPKTSRETGRCTVRRCWAPVVAAVLVLLTFCFLGIAGFFSSAPRQTTTPRQSALGHLRSVERAAQAVGGSLAQVISGNSNHVWRVQAGRIILVSVCTGGGSLKFFLDGRPLGDATCASTYRLSLAVTVQTRAPEPETLSVRPLASQHYWVEVTR